jgi:hypothetical protein
LVLHAVPQLPQLFASLLRSVHVRGDVGVGLQTVCPSGQLQVPNVHDAPTAQMVPQLPQLLVSLATHVPPQKSCPPGH